MRVIVGSSWKAKSMKHFLGKWRNGVARLFRKNAIKGSLTYCSVSSNEIFKIKKKMHIVDASGI